MRWHTIYNKYFTRNSIFISNVITLASSLISTIICLRIFDFESYGEISFIIKSANIITFITNFGIAYSLNQYPNFIFDKSKVFYLICLLIFSMNFAISMIFYLNYSEGKYALIGVMIVQILSFLLLFYSFLNGNLNLNIYAILRISQSLIPVLYLFGAFLFEFEMSANNYLFSLIFIYSITTLFALFKIAMKPSLRLRMHKKVSVQVHEFLYFGKNTYFVQLYRSLHLNLDFLILGFIVSPKSFTEYSLAVTLAMTPQIYLASKQVSAQTLARDTRSRDSIVLNVRSTIKTNIFVSIFFLFTEVVLFVLFHDYVFEESINNILLLLIILAPAYLIDVSSAYIGNLLIGLGQSEDYSALQLRGFVLNLMFLSIGIIFFGMIGAAIASLLSYSYVFYVSIQLLGAIKLKK